MPMCQQLQLVLDFIHESQLAIEDIIEFLLELDAADGEEQIGDSQQSLVHRWRVIEHFLKLRHEEGLIECANGQLSVEEVH